MLIKTKFKDIVFIYMEYYMKLNLVSIKGRYNIIYL